MSPDEFRHAAKLGLGRAIVHLQAHPWQPHEKALLDLCQHTPAYDAQCEESRVPYVYELVCQTKVPLRFAAAVTEAIPRTGDDHDLNHLLGLAVRFARDGYAPAREALYRWLRTSPDPRFGASHLLELDGVAGFRMVCEELGQRLSAGSLDWEDDDLVATASRELGVEAVAAVRREEVTNDRIRQYFGAVDAYRQAQQAKESPRPPVTYADFLNALALDPVLPVIRWRRRVTDEDLVLAAEAIRSGLDAKLLLAHLRVFHVRAFPIDPAPLIALVRAPEERVAWAALEALRHVRHPYVRTLALDMIAAKRWAGSAARLLAANYAPGDEHLVEGLLHALDPDDVHDAGHAARDMAANPAADILPMLTTLYERDPCSICRRGAVERLVERSLAPAWMLHECLHDCSLDTRDLAAKALNVERHGS